MWETIKEILLLILVVGVLLTLWYVLRRCSPDRRGSTGDAERNRRIEEGIESAESSAERCEDHLQRAEDILRNAVERSRKKKQKAEDSDNGNGN